ncbi:CapA family protein [Pseudonocardia pini]|uniref:CapA family protein n=1 Tax=Pseudonocardia pini TaxID=2758030 RepID=UPI0015EFE8BB|nr:CapA family protein [Pseudonocardia pini]
MSQPGPTVVLATGDVFPDLADNEAVMQPLVPLFEHGIVFGNCEGVYTDRPELAPSRVAYGGTSRDRGEMFGRIGFDVMTLANNHMIDGGYAGLDDTMELLHGQGIQTTGAGANLDQATTAAIVERDGRRIAFLGFCAEFPMGYEAKEGRPGIAPLRIETVYRNPLPGFWQPGLDPEVLTIPLESDVERIHAAVARAREQADHVVVAFHWGSNTAAREVFVPDSRTHTKTYRDAVQAYELEIARATVDRGADAVVCHHQASLRGMEMHGGRPIFYGLGVLMHHFHRTGGRTGSDHKIITSWDEQAYPYWPFERPEALLTGVARLAFGPDGIEAGFVPALVRPDGSTTPLAADDPRTEDVARHLEALNAFEGFDTVLSRERFHDWRLLSVKTSA